MSHTVPTTAGPAALTVTPERPTPNPTPTSPIEDGRFAPRPIRRTVALRTFIPWQMVRFAVINLRMFRIIAKSHD